MRVIVGVVVHHSAGAPDLTVEEVDREHRARGFSGIGYHWLVHLERDTWIVSPGRPEGIVGAHDLGQNIGTIGVCVAGDYTRGPVPPEAWRQLVLLVVWLCARYRLSAEAVEGHREHEPRTTPTACPGFDPATLRAAIAAQLGAVA